MITQHPLNRKSFNPACFIFALSVALSLSLLVSKVAVAQEEELPPEEHQLINQVFLCIPGANGIPGNSTVAGFEGCHQATGVSYGIQSAVAQTGGAGAAVGRPVLSAVEVMRSVDESSLLFFQKITLGRTYPTATIVQATVDTVDNVVVATAFSLKLEAVSLTKIETVLAETPTEKIGLSANALRVTIGGASTCWNKSSGRATCPAN